MPKIVIDARMLSDIPHGIARYVCAMAKALEAKAESQGELSYQPVFLIDSKYEGNFTRFEQVKVSAPFLNPRELLEIPRILSDLNAALFHSPSFCSLSSTLGKSPCPWVLTLHDLNHLTYGDLTKKIYYQTLLKPFARKAKKVMAVSEFAQREVSEWLNVPSESIPIVYNVIESAGPPLDSESSEVLEKFQLEKGKFFFSLSNPKPHKNLPLLTAAYRRFRAQQSSAWPLVLTVQNEEVDNAPGIRAIGGLTEIEARVLLEGSGGLLFPSLYEGFGLPPVEAAVAGTPIAVSRIAPHQEALIDLLPSEVEWVNPKDVHGWVSAFHRLYKREVAPASAQSRQKILDRFSSKRMGLSLDQIYRDVLGLGEL